jgi:hypothetical protein
VGRPAPSRDVEKRVDAGCGDLALKIFQDPSTGPGVEKELVGGQMHNFMKKLLG